MYADTKEERLSIKSFNTFMFDYRNKLELFLPQGKK